MRTRHSIALLVRTFRLVSWILTFLLRRLPGRVLWVRPLHVRARPRWTNAWRLLAGTPVLLLDPKTITHEPPAVAIAAWTGGAVRRRVLSAADALALAGCPQVHVADHCAAGGDKHHHHRRIPRLLGVACNYMDVTASLRPWFASVSTGALSATGVALLSGLGHASRHMVDALWDDLEETHAEGCERIRHVRTLNPKHVDFSESRALQKL